MAISELQRRNHFRHWLTALWGSDMHVPESMIEQVRVSLELHGSPPTLESVNWTLSAINAHIHKDCAAKITARLTGMPLPTMTTLEADRIMDLFQQILAPYARHATPQQAGRFLQYSYCALKLCELAQLPQFLPLLRKMLSVRFIPEFDALWALICNDLGWKFIQTV